MIGWGESTVIFLVALMVLGPKRIPEVARMVGHLMKQFREASDELKRNLMLDDVDDLRQEFRKTWRDAQNDPVRRAPSVDDAFDATDVEHTEIDEASEDVSVTDDEPVYPEESESKIPQEESQDTEPGRKSEPAQTEDQDEQRTDSQTEEDTTTKEKERDNSPL